MFRVYTTDDRGRRVPLVRVNTTLIPLGRSAVPKAVEERARRAVANSAERFTPADAPKILVYALIPSLFTFGPLFVVIFYRPSWLSLLAVLVSLPLLVVLAWLTMHGLAPRMLTPRQRQLAATAVASGGYCGSCGYQLPGAAEEDGLHVCPECGAAWRRTA